MAVSSGTLKRREAAEDPRLVGHLNDSPTLMVMPRTPEPIPLWQVMVANITNGQTGILLGSQFFGPDARERNAGNILGGFRCVGRVRKELEGAGIVAVIQGRPAWHGYDPVCSLMIPGPHFEDACKDLPELPPDAWTPALERNRKAESPELARANDFLGRIQFSTHLKTVADQRCPRPYAGNGPLILRHLPPRKHPDLAPGRLYGYGPTCPQSLPRKLRPWLSMTLDDREHQAQSCIDVSAYGVRRLFAMNDKVCPGDPYACLAERLNISRDIAKEITQVIINNKDPEGVRKSLRRRIRFYGLLFGVDECLEHAQRVLAPIWDMCQSPTCHVIHPGDGVFMLGVIHQCATQGIPLVPIHDGILVPTELVVPAMHIMEQEMHRRFGQVFPTKTEAITGSAT